MQLVYAFRLKRLSNFAVLVLLSRKTLLGLLIPAPFGGVFSSRLFQARDLSIAGGASCL